MRMIGSVPEVRNISHESSLAMYLTPSTSFISPSGEPSNSFGGSLRYLPAFRRFVSPPFPCRRRILSLGGRSRSGVAQFFGQLRSLGGVDPLHLPSRFACFVELPELHVGFDKA